MKKLQYSYLYSDGHAVLVYEDRVKLGGVETPVEYAVIYEKWTAAQLRFTGRLCFSRYCGSGFLDLAKRATQVTATVPSLQNGSDNTKKLGIDVGYLAFDFKDGTSLSWNTMPSIISGNHSYQPDNKEAFDPHASFWGNTRVTKIERAKSPALVAA